MALEHEALTERIIGAAIKVHDTSGPVFSESVYEKALIIELKKRGLTLRDHMELIIKTQASHCFLRPFLPSSLAGWNRAR